MAKSDAIQATLQAPTCEQTAIKLLEDINWQQVRRGCKLLSSKTIFSAILMHAGLNFNHRKVLSDRLRDAT